MASTTTTYLISTDANKCGSVEVDDAGQLQKMTMYPVAPNPDNLPGKSPGGISTQWLVQHPTLPLVIALTSYWNTRPAQLTCFQLDDDGKALTKLPVEATTKGREAVYAVFSPHKEGAETVTLAVAHHNDGMVTFFTFSTKELPTATVPLEPTLTLELPELIPGSKTVLSTKARAGLSKPSSHHILYDRMGQYLWIVDPNQSAVFTYTVNPQTGLPQVDDETIPMPTSVFHCHTDAPSLTWFGSLVGKVMGLTCRPRRMAVSPNGEYVFILYETRNVIQVYGVNPKTGEILDTECLQEVSTLDPALLDQPIIGLTFQAAAELIVYGNALYVSNRGNAVFAGVLGRAGENSIRVFSIRDGGRLAVRPKSVECSGPVRHFWIGRQSDDGKEVLVAGTSSQGPNGQSLQTFVRDMDKSLNEDHPNDYELVGEANVEVNVFCVLPTNSGRNDDNGIPSTKKDKEKQELETKKKELETKKKKEMEDTISQMEEQAMQASFSNHNKEDEDAVLVDSTDA